MIHYTIEPAVVSITLEKINRVIGTELSRMSVRNIFDRLQFEVIIEENAFTVTAPTRRGDIKSKKIWLKKLPAFTATIIFRKHLPIGSTTPGGLNRSIRRNAVWFANTLRVPGFTKP